MAKTYPTILVPVDFSEMSRAALHHAVELLTPGGTLLVAHVVDDTPMTYGYVGLNPSVNEMRSQMAEAADAELKGFVTQPSVEGEIKPYILHGAPHREIVRLAEQKDVDLIVMSTHGRSGLPHALLGSVAEHVVQKAPCAVLVLREKKEKTGD